MMNIRSALAIVSAVTTVVYGSSAALAQGQPAQNNAQVPPRPAASAPATTPTVAAPAASAGLASARVKGSASPEVARRDYAAKLATRQSACTAKGALYRWKAPHNVGDAIAGSNPVQYWATAFNGGCVQVGLKDALATGAVTLRGN